MARRYSALRGTRDILPEEIGGWRLLEETTRDVFQRYGFQEIRTPLLESTELFARSVGEDTDIVHKEMYTFSRGKESVSLRPESTASVVRAFVEHSRYRHVGRGFPERLFYIGPMFRYERPQRGRQRQFHQLGAEVLGADEALVDAESIKMSWSLLSALGVASSQLLLNSVGDPACRPAYRERLVGWLRERAQSLCEDCGRRIESNPLRVLDCKTDRDLVRSAPRLVDHLCGACQSHFDQVKRWLDRFDVPFEVDGTIVRGLDYYRRTVFEIVSDGLGAQNAMLGGGRYDGLVDQIGGPDVPGFGFAAGIERLLMLVEGGGGDAGKPDVALIALGEAGMEAVPLLAERLRDAGWRVVSPVAERPLGAQLKRADRVKAAFALFVGQRELADDAYGLKNLTTGEQTTVTADEIGARLEEHRDRS